MRNNFLCYSIIIIMLDTMLIKHCTCRSDDDRSVVGLRSGNMTTLARDNESNALEVAGHTRLCDTAQSDSSHGTCETSTGTLLYTTYAWARETTKCMKRNVSKSKKFEDTSWNAAECHRASTEMPAKLITYDASCVLNFKVRKKETKKTRSVQSAVCSSHRNSSYITTETCLSTCVNFCDLPNRSQHFTPRLKRRRNKANGNLGTIGVFTNLEKPRRTRKKKLNATCEFNCASYNVSEKCFRSVKSRKSSGRLLSSINKISLSTNPQNNYKKIEKNSTKSVDQEWDRITTTNPKRKLLRQELIELLRNQSLYHQTTPARKNPFSKTASTVLSNTSFISHTSWSASRLSPKATFFPPMAQNFLYSEESKLNLCDSGNESLGNEFDEIRLNAANSVAEKLNLQHSKERILYVPKNDSVKWYSRFLDESTRKEHSTRIKKCKMVKENFIKINNQQNTKAKKQRVKALVRESECTLLKKNITKKSHKSTPFDMYDFFLHQKPHQNPLLELKSTGKQNQLHKSRTQTTKLNLKRKKNLNWNQFLMSPEKINVDEEGPTVNVFSESQEAQQPVVNSSETMSPQIVTPSIKELPDTGECDQLWNQTFPTGLSNELNVDKSSEICTLSSLEAIQLIRRNFSGLLTTRSFLSRLSPFHPLLHPFATKFDNSILPKAEEAKAIVAKFLNESVELQDDSVALETKPDVTSVCPLERLNELDFSDMSMSYEWKMLYDNARRTTQTYTDMTDLPIELPDTVEAEHILHDFSCPNMFRTLASRRNQVQSESPRISTLSMQEAKHMFGRLGVELFGQQFRININHRAPTKKHKVMHSMVKNKMPDRVLKNKKVEGYVMKMMTEVSPGSQDQEVYVPWQSEESGAVVKLNFNMKLFLSKLCTYLSDWKHKNETRDLPASKKPRQSFLLGKPAFFKKRKNALI